MVVLFEQESSEVDGIQNYVVHWNVQGFFHLKTLKWDLEGLILLDAQ